MIEVIARRTQWHEDEAMSKGVRTVAGRMGVFRWSRARSRHRAAAMAWCAEKGYSYTMTVLGWARPSPDEVAEGRTGTPWGGAPRPRDGWPTAQWSGEQSDGDNSAATRITRDAAEDVDDDAARREPLAHWSGRCAHPPLDMS